MAEVILTTTESGCIVPTSHKLNKDGYFRRRLPGGEYVMYHRYVWSLEFGEIPDDYEINHMCKNRACCNIDHLECILGTEHAIKTNTERYADRLEEAHKQWVDGWTAKQLASYHNVSDSCAYRWIRDWKV